ncbi:MAG TPA: hypothetical protein PK076_12145 [Saprospiraceae bacterium]|nr:hypothetical protein [Saprospiraceae bacterium]HQW56875.1 hypothetical protein [Saprospiraceae bacterium]
MKKFLIKFILLILVLAVGFFAFAYYASFGEGVRTGNLIKLSHKGYVVKTWEGALDVGVFQGAVPTTGRIENTIWEFSVPDAAIAAKIEAANQRGSRLSLTYKEKYFKIFWKGYTKNWVIDVVELPYNTNNNLPGNQQQPQQNQGYQQAPQQNQGYQQQPQQNQGYQQQPQQNQGNQQNNQVQPNQQQQSPAQNPATPERPGSQQL